MEQKPLDRLPVVLPDAFPVIVADPQIALRLGIPLFGGPAIPLDRFPVVLVDSESVVVAGAEFVLRPRVILFGGAAVPFERFPRVPLDALPVLVADPQIILRFGIPLFSGLAKLGNGSVAGNREGDGRNGQEEKREKRRGAKPERKSRHKTPLFAHRLKHKPGDVFHHRIQQRIFVKNTACKLPEVESGPGSGFAKGPSWTIAGKPGSYAEMFARQNGLKCTAK